MSNWMADLNEMQRYQTLLKEANEHRLAMKRFKGRSRKQNFVRRVIEWMQRSLLSRGSSLVERISKQSAIKLLAAKPNEAD